MAWAECGRIVGSTFLRNINKGRRVRDGDVRYTIVGSRYDEVTTPYVSTFFLAAPATPRNLLLQTVVSSMSDHVALAYSPRAVWIVLDAFDPAVRWCVH